MGKIVNNTHITGERGVLRFHQYCNSHIPYICFREVIRNDFGIDGEIELTRLNEEGKKEVTGELLKVQIKSSAGIGGYIRKRRDGSFSFSASKADLEYWSKHNLGVLLIIYDDDTGNLYAKKINKADFLGAKRKSFPIDFGAENRLEAGKNDFVQRFSADFKTRVSFDTSEILVSNLMRVKQHPRKLYVYDSKFSSKKELFEALKNQSEAPYFALYANKIITGNPIVNDFKVFCECAVVNPQTSVVVPYEEILKNQTHRRNLVELLNLILKDYLGAKGVHYSKEYKRYYFSKPKDQDGRSIEKTSVKTGKMTSKKIVTYHTYGKDKFYRHVAFEVDYIFNQSEIFLVLNPKYFFTVDGKETLPPKKITKYTNYLTSREYNDAVQDQLYVISNFLSKQEGGLEITLPGDLKFHLSRFISQHVAFGIPSDIPVPRVSEKKQKEERAAAERAKQTSFL